jgi:hypothetical protein
LNGNGLTDLLRGINWGNVVYWRDAGSLGLVNSTTLTITYTDADLAGMQEDTLALRYWDGAAWSTEGITIVERDTAHNRLVATLTHLSQFRLFARGEHALYLPLMLRSQQ